MLLGFCGFEGYSVITRREREKKRQCQDAMRLKSTMRRGGKNNKSRRAREGLKWRWGEKGDDGQCEEAVMGESDNTV